MEEDMNSNRHHQNGNVRHPDDSGNLYKKKLQNIARISSDYK